MKPVRYPASRSAVAMVRESSKTRYPQGSRCDQTWCRWAWTPVKNDARAGQHSGYDENELRNVSPCFPTSRRIWGANRRSSTRRSSAITTTMLGRAARAWDSSVAVDVLVAGDGAGVGTVPVSARTMPSAGARASTIVFRERRSIRRG